MFVPMGNPSSLPIPDPILHFQLWPLACHTRWTMPGACRPSGPFLPPQPGQLLGSLTSNGLRGDGSFLQAPLTPDTQGFLPLHLRGRILSRHQGLCSWGQRSMSFGVFSEQSSSRCSWGQERSRQHLSAREPRVPVGKCGGPREAEGPRSREIISVQDKGVGQASG